MVRAASSTTGTTAMHIAALDSTQRAAVERLVQATGYFRDEEVAIAMEVLDAYFAAPDRDYSALAALDPHGSVAGYIVYGPTPATSGTFDFYWIAVAPEQQRAGVGTLLLAEMERRLEGRARLLLVETSGQPLYAPTRTFYERRGYREVARVPDFYADGDDRVIFARRVI